MPRWDGLVLIAAGLIGFSIAAYLIVAVAVVFWLFEVWFGG
jgi:hypothetical protein